MMQLPVRNDSPKYAPVANLMLYTIEECNMRCTYCFVDKKPRSMSSAIARKTLEWFLSRDISGSLPSVNINFFGGEPFMALDRMEEIVALAKELAPAAHKRVSFSATTNGSIATPRAESLIRETRMSLLVSLDGDLAASRDRKLVSGRNSYPIVARNLPKLLQWSEDVIIRMTFTPGTLNLVDNVRHVLSLGATSIMLYPVLECDWERHQAELEAAYAGLEEFVQEEVLEGRVPPLVATWELLCQLDRVVRFGADRPGRPCNVGTSLLAVDPDGNVMPCHRFLYRRQDWLGTVDSTSLSRERWKYVHLASSDFSDCEACPAKWGCGGGCRVVALNARKSLHQTYDPYCVTMRAHASMVESLYRFLQSYLGSGLPRFMNGLHFKVRNDVLGELARAG